MQKQELSEIQLDDVHVFFVKRVWWIVSRPHSTNLINNCVSELSPTLSSTTQRRKDWRLFKGSQSTTRKVEMVGFYLQKQRESNPLLGLPRFAKLAQKCLSKCARHDGICTILQNEGCQRNRLLLQREAWFEQQAFRC